MLIPSTYTVNDLPVELLSLIFEVGGSLNQNEEENVPQYWDGRSFHRIEKETPQAPVDDRRPPSFRIAVSLVCHHWYHVAISTPSLWTTLRLACWDSFERLQTMLSRSGVLPLDIVVYYYIEVEAPGAYPQDDWTLPQTAQPYITLFRGLAPRLRSMHLWETRISWSDPWILSLSNLTTLDLAEPDQDARPSWAQFIAMLRSAPALKRIVLRYAGPFDSPDDWDHQSTAGDGTLVPNVPIPLLYLTDIVLVEEEIEYGERLLRTFYTPALKVLSLELYSDDDLYTTFIEVLAGPATLPSPNTAVDGKYSLLNRLEHLYIKSLDWVNNIPSIQMLYDGLHNLTLLQITLSKSPATPKLLNLLLPHTPYGQDNAVRLPRLETLIVCRDSDEAIVLQLIQKVVRTRKKVGFPVKSLYVQAIMYMRDHKEESRFRNHVETFSFFSG